MLPSETTAAAPVPRLWRGESLALTIRWAFNAGYAVLDQLLFALSNFAINVVMARWLTPQDYAAFTLAYTIFLILGTVHTALLADPLVVFGAGKYKDHLNHYHRSVLRAHWQLAGAASLLLGACGVALLALNQREIGLALLAVAVASPFILLLWLMRRSCYVRVEPHLAAAGSLAYLVILVAGAYMLYRGNLLSVAAAFALMAIGGAAAALLIRVTLSFPGSDTNRSSIDREVATDHWAYGRWAIGTGLLGAVMLQLYYFVMPAWHMLEGTATLKALTNCAMPALQSYWALSVLMVPKLVRVRGTPAFGGLIRTLFTLYSIAALGYWALLGIFHGPLVRAMYGGRYESESSLLWGLGLLPLAAAGVSVVESALRALARSDAIFRAYVFAAAATIAIGVPLTFAWGVGGAIAGLLIAHAVAMLFIASALRRLAGEVAPEQ